MKSLVVTLNNLVKYREREQQNIAVVVFVSQIVYFRKETRAVCPNINPMMICVYDRDVNYLAPYAQQIHRYWADKIICPLTTYRVLSQQV